MKKSAILAIWCLWLAEIAVAQQIDRSNVVGRNSPRVASVDTLSSFTVGNGHFAFTVDATGLQTFPEHYKNGIPLGTMSDWGWHSFPNLQGFVPTEALQSRNFGRGHEEIYALEDRQPGHRHNAVAYLRQNPHRLHLGCVGLDLKEVSKVSDVNQTLDLWNGMVDSRFCYDSQPFHLQTVCHPDIDAIASKVETRGEVAVVIRIPYPTGNHSDDACDWSDDKPQTITLVARENSATLDVAIDDTRYVIDVNWVGNVAISLRDSHSAVLCSKDGTLDFSVAFRPADKIQEISTESFDDVRERAATWWHRYWRDGGIADFSHVADPRAAELERRVVLSQYLLAVNDVGDTPPQETGLTYNSWFGKFHLEMIWWHQAQFALWGHPEMLERSLMWYFRAADKAREIAARQGFDGIRWMKMTDPSAEEAPSNVGSFLIWQQPHIIYLAELLFRAATSAEDRRRILEEFGELVEASARFMASFASYDADSGRYVLKGCIPAQETLRADSTLNPPLELSYWHWGLQTAQRWRERIGKQRLETWDEIVGKLSSLAYGRDGLYLAAESAPDSYVNIRYISDHPAVLGAVGMLPKSRLADDERMKRTLRWVMSHWNWDKTWGWDFPMTAMCAARLNDPEMAVDALLMDCRTNTYLNNGHNYQDARLRVYLPGNGGLLTAVAMMLAGWDGSDGSCPGFPPDWDIRWEGILPLP